MGREITLNLSEIRYGFIGDPNIGVVVPVYDAEADNIANYVGFMARKGSGSEAVWNYEFGGNYNCKRIDGGDYLDCQYTLALKGMAPNWQLLFVIREVLAAVGYEADLSEYDHAPYNRIYLSCPAAQMKAALPHWTLREFIEQVQDFLGALAVFDSSKKIVSFRVSTNLLRGVQKYEVADDFSVEVSDESEVKSVLSSNLAYSQSSVDYHVYDFIADDVLDGMAKKEFASYSELTDAYNAATDADKKNYLWVCPQGCFAYWNENSTTKLMHVNLFSKLRKNEDENDMELKIAPAAMSDDITYPIYGKEYFNGTSNHGGNNGVTREVGCCYAKLPVLERRNPSVRSYDGATIQEIIEGAEPEQEATEKPDRIDVMFYDGHLQKVQAAIWGEAESRLTSLPIPMGFTAYDYKNEGGIEHEKWSLALTPQQGMSSMADVQNTQIIRAKQKYFIKFLSETLPSAEDIFIFNGKKYLAEKIEGTIVNGRLSPLMSGYFYEYI